MNDIIVKAMLRPVFKLNSKSRLKISGMAESSDSLPFSWLEKVPRLPNMTENIPFTLYFIPFTSNSCNWEKKILSFSSHVLITFLFCVCLAHAGQRENFPAAAGVALTTDSIKPLQIGDTIPEALWNLPLQMVQAGQEGSTTITLNDYKGKLIILDFWATWCSPCVAAFPKMDSLREVFVDDLAIIPVTKEKRETVAAFFARMHRETGRKAFSVIGDDVLHGYFRHHVIPHYVWIGPERTVSAITEGEAITKRSITEFLERNIVPLAVKHEELSHYDPNVPMMMGINQVDPGDLSYHSVFTGYLTGINPSLAISQDKKRITALNASPLWLYRVAYGEFRTEFLNPNRIRLELADKDRVTTDLAGVAYTEWLNKYGHSYELVVPPEDSVQLFRFMRQDLDRFLGYRCNIEKTLTTCLVLRRTSEEDMLKTKGGKAQMKRDLFSLNIRNMLWKNFTGLLDIYYLQNIGMPFLDETGYSGKVDLDINARMTNPSELNKALKAYHLELVEEERNVEMIVLRDKQQNEKPE
ncbi:TlpA family protein disulfide reductase [Olivibacter sp. SDN3]|uniref:TlpA family protein disulfide reductase n=1 Tax=Olivibacter sp. SDN3 TaxID=2764720 RepID=UPI0016510D89|nr:TlpA disulfide reductase family protein [Olivibacter sp. SDN3]QNL51962.1 TlpA family protein disulfide reductase [Olivibacter sp. SDN3]